MLQGAVGVMPPAVSGVLKETYGLRESTYGALFLPMLGIAILTALSAQSIRRVLSPRALFLAGLGIDIVFLLLLASVAAVPPPVRVPLLFGAHGLFGVSLAFMGIALNSGAVAIFPRTQGAALSALHGVLGVGAAISPMLVNFFRTRGIWWVAPCLVAVTLVVPMALAVARRPHCFVERGEARMSWCGLGRRFWLRGAPAVLYGVTESALTAWAILYLIGERHLPMSSGSRALSAFWVAMTLGRGLSTIVVRRVSALSLTIALSLATTLACFFVIAIRTETGALLAYAFAGLACSGVAPLLMALASVDEPERTPLVSAWFSATLMFGLMIGACGAGPLAEGVGMERVFWGVAALPLLLAACVYGLRRSSSR